jgi:hypothetical protein
MDRPWLPQIARKLVGRQQLTVFENQGGRCFPKVFCQVHRLAYGTDGWLVTRPVLPNSNDLLTKKLDEGAVRNTLSTRLKKK